MDYFVAAELEACCASLGHETADGASYIKEHDCIATVRQLCWLLRRENESRPIRRKLGQLNVLPHDLLCLLRFHALEDDVLFDAVLKLMQILTTPAVICFEKLPTDTQFRSYYDELERYLHAYKVAFADEEAVKVLSFYLQSALNIDILERTDELNVRIERILVLIRNLLHVPFVSDDNHVNDDITAHDRIIWLYNQQNIDSLILYMATEESERRKWGLYALEIIYNILRNYDPSDLASTGQNKENCELRLLRNTRNIERQERLERHLKSNSRHSRFGGTLVVNNMKALSNDSKLIYHGPLAKAYNISFDDLKPQKRKNVRHLQPKDSSEKHYSTLAIRLALKEFVVNFVVNSFNQLVNHIMSCLARQKAEVFDQTYLIWSIGFFSCFNRNHKFRPSLVESILKPDILHLLQTHFENCFEMAFMERKNRHQAAIWTQRIKLGITAYNEILLLLEALKKISFDEDSEDNYVCINADIVRRQLMNSPESRDIIPMLFKKFDCNKMPLTYIQQVVFAQSLYMRLLESVEKDRGGNGIVVTSRKRKFTKTKKKSTLQPLSIEEIISRINFSMDTFYNKQLPEVSAPYDPLSEVPESAQHRSVMCEVRRLLLSNCPLDALAVLRSGRSLWPNTDVFGSPSITLEEEVEALSAILHSNSLTVNLKDIKISSSSSEEKKNSDLSSPGEMTKTLHFTVDTFFNKELPEVRASYDPLSELPESSQHETVISEIRNLLLSNRPLEALSVLRDARNLWPTTDVFGSSTITLEEEVAALNTISNNLDEMPANLSEKCNNEELSVDMFIDQSLPTIHAPFDPLAEISDEEQVNNVKCEIYGLLKSGNALEALSMYRDGRSIWPSGMFGNEFDTLEDDVSALNMILKSDQYHKNVEIDDVPSDNPCSSKILEEELGESSPDEFCDVVLKSDKYFDRFITPQVLYCYSLLFKNYRNNSPLMNRVCLKFFHTIAVKKNFPGLFFQASIFRVFQKIFSDLHLKSVHVPGIEELATFAKFICRRFFETVRKNKVVFVELLFWKNSIVANEITDGYGNYRTSAERPKLILWNDDECEELRNMFNELAPVAKEEGFDVVDRIVQNLAAKNRSRRAVISQLVRLNCVSHSSELKKVRKKKTKINDPVPQIQPQPQDIVSSDSDNELDAFVDEIMGVKRKKRRILLSDDSE